MRARLAKDKVPVPGSGPKAKVFLSGLSGLSDFVAKAEPELAANAMLCAVNQAAYLLRRQLESQDRAFLEKGGFTESLYAARSHARSAREPRPRPAPAPVCPKCGRPMLRRTAKTGAHAGQAFYGCSAYPKCKGIRPITQTGQTGQTGPTGQTNT
jgi:four helix bundle suffix protein